MAILTPVNITHNNPELPTVYFSDVKGNIWATGSDGNQYGIPEAKRELGMVVYFSSSQDFKYYKGGTTASIDWSSPLSWSMFGGGSTYFQGPGITIDVNNYISASVRTVNGIGPFSNGNIVANLTAVLTGPSSSDSPNNLIGSSSGTVTGSIANATVWVVSGDTSTPDPNGLAYIFISQSSDVGNAGKWFPLSYINQPTADLRYVRISTGSSVIQAITSSLLISGSTTFSGSLFWSGASDLGGATNNVLVLGSNGQIYKTGSYGGGGGGGGTNVKAGSIAPSTFGGTPRTASITFNSNFSDTNYGVSIMSEDARIWTIQTKLISGFTINSNSSVNLTTSASWIASPLNNP